MKSIELRKRFINFFKSKKHNFIPSSPIVLKDDPTLMFVNAGMNQFKDIFLGNKDIIHSRVVNSQKCLRVSGKHNDLEEVGHDTYHHTMFEMLGNWSFGDYYKENAILMAWEFLTDVLKIDKDRLYVTYFSGDNHENLIADKETRDIWSNILNSDRIIQGSKVDNFWEMGKTGPCGPSTEIHIDLRKEEDRKSVSACKLINQDHPEVIEIWNLVFVSLNRMEDNSLVTLPLQHVDTGMGFERLCMVVQNKISSYDTDVFTDLIKKMSLVSNIHYGQSPLTDIAIRVIVDHIRAIVFTILDGQLPSNTGPGYVIRRILRRAVRYGYTYLNLKIPFLHQLVYDLSVQFKDIYPEITNQREMISNVIKEEEKTFLKTLGKGLRLINNSINSLPKHTREMDGSAVFELYDTYGFPPDLTSLILKENGLLFSQKKFNIAMQEQKNRSKNASEITVSDWIEIQNVPIEGFVGYDKTTLNDVKIIKYRRIVKSGKVQFHLVFNRTCFYPEGGGQLGDKGVMRLQSCDSICIIDTKKENNIIIHVANELFKNINTHKTISLELDCNHRRLCSSNHSATHLLHHELRLLLGSHVEQKGSYVGSDYLRFDFSHFHKINNEIIIQIEKKINELILKDIQLDEYRNISINEAKKMGALALFGEKYGSDVRVIKFGDSVELCGGTHISSTSQIGLFKIVSESSVASGVRRVEALTSHGAFKFLNNKLLTLNQIELKLKKPDNIINAVDKLVCDNKDLSKLVDKSKKQSNDLLIDELSDQIISSNDIKYLFLEINIDPSSMKNICFSFINKYEDIIVAISTVINGKIILNIALSKPLISKNNLNASKLINMVSHHINGKGGGQPFFAVCSGDNVDGITNVFTDLKDLIQAH